VGVGDQHQPQAVQSGAEPGQGHLDPSDPRHAHRFGVPPEEQDQDDQGDHRGGEAIASRSADPGGPQDAGEQPAEQRPGEQHPDHAEHGVGDPGGTVGVPAAVAREHQHGERDEGEREDGRAGHHHGRRPPVARDDEGPPGHAEQQEKDRGHGQPEPDHARGAPARLGFHRFTNRHS
jgi:hypothetical protein